MSTSNIVITLSWREALCFVQPRTVTTWQEKRFRDYWHALSQSSSQVDLGFPGNS
jgi:hypothetical protein